MKKSAAALMLLLGLGALACAEPLPGGQVSADATWLVHLDFDAAKAAATVGKLGDAWLSQDSSKRNLEWLRKAVGFDPTRDLHSITFYGKRIGAPDAVVLVRAAVDLPRLQGFLEKLPDYRTLSHRGRRLHAWSHRCGEQRRQEAVACLDRPGLIVFGHRADDVASALDVLDGKAASLADGDSPLAEQAAAGTILRVAATGLADAELPFKSSMVRLSDRIFLALGESDGEVFLEAKVLAKSSEAAGEIHELVKGFRAAAGLLSGSDADVTRLLERLELTAAERTVTLRWRGPGDDVLRAIENSRKRLGDWGQRREEYMKGLLEKYDANRDGKLDDEEKRAARADGMKRRDQRKRKMLEKYDANKNGQLDDDERGAMRAEWLGRMQELKNPKEAP